MHFGHAGYSSESRDRRGSTVLTVNLLRMCGQSDYSLTAVVVMMLHIAFGWVMIHGAMLPVHTAGRAEPLVITFIDRKTTAQISHVTANAPLPHFTFDTSESPPSAFKAETPSESPIQLAGRTLPPRLDSPTVDIRDFAHQAGVSPGSGATVVLRIEVSGDGTVGHVQIEVSGGNRRIDDAAVAYVRTLRWFGGRIDNQPATLWIRWGVRFDS